MPLSKEKMREYQRNRRKRQKQAREDCAGRPNSCQPDVNYPVNQSGVNPECKPENVNLPANFGQPDCECKDCQCNRASGMKKIINHGAWKSAEQLAANEINRVSLPGDVDYKRYVKPEPKDVKLPSNDELFKGLPPSVRTYAKTGGREYKSLIHHLRQTPIAKLEEEGGFIPCWRHAIG